LTLREYHKGEWALSFFLNYSLGLPQELISTPWIMRLGLNIMKNFKIISLNFPPRFYLIMINYGKMCW
jgi:hypothetical protein